MKARWRDSCDEAGDEVARVEEDGAGAVFPDVFESELELAIGAEFQAVLSKRGPRDIPAEALTSAFGASARRGSPTVVLR